MCMDMVYQRRLLKQRNNLYDKYLHSNFASEKHCAFTLRMPLTQRHSYCFYSAEQEVVIPRCHRCSILLSEDLVILQKKTMLFLLLLIPNSAAIVFDSSYNCVGGISMATFIKKKSNQVAGAKKKDKRVAFFLVLPAIVIEIVYVVICRALRRDTIMI